MLDVTQVAREVGVVLRLLDYGSWKHPFSLLPYDSDRSLVLVPIWVDLEDLF